VSGWVHEWGSGGGHHTKLKHQAFLLHPCSSTPGPPTLSSAATKHSVPQPLTLDLAVVGGRVPHQQGGRLPVEGVCGVGVQQQLRQEHLKHVDEVKHGGPGLVDHVQADGAGAVVVFGAAGAGRVDRGVESPAGLGPSLSLSTLGSSADHHYDPTRTERARTHPSSTLGW